jgi:alkanesulfonate monooxygenase SsuD/methylene tetrahydromethanopterin reductase-like flavin-dependent oxidoreductase (luciferase family)
MTARPFHFLGDASEIVSGPELVERARRAEQLGYHALVFPDHLLGQLSPVVAMTAVAAATSTLRVAAFVLNNDLRHPAVLAQDLAASTSCPVGGSMSRSAPGGTSPSTTRSG